MCVLWWVLVVSHGLLGITGSGACRLSSCAAGLVALRHVGSWFPDDGLNLIPSIGRRIPTTGPPGKSLQSGHCFVVVVYLPNMTWPPTWLVFPSGSDSKESACKAGDQGLIPGFGKIPWRREWQPTPVFLPGKSHGQSRLGGLRSMGSQRVGHGWAAKHAWKKDWGFHLSLCKASVLPYSLLSK